MSRQRARGFALPYSNLGNQASGASTVRPSVSSTLSVSFVTATFSAATSRNSFVKVFIPTVQQLLPILLDQPLQMIQFVTAKTAALCQSNRVQPELCSVPLAFHVNVRRFIPIRPRRRKTDMARFAMQSALVPDNIPSPSICPPFRILQKPCLSMKTSIAAIKDAVYFGVPGFAFGTRDSATADRQKWIVCQVE